MVSFVSFFSPIDTLIPRPTNFISACVVRLYFVSQCHSNTKGPQTYYFLGKIAGRSNHFHCWVSISSIMQRCEIFPICYGGTCQSWLSFTTVKIKRVQQQENITMSVNTFQAGYYRTEHPSTELNFEKKGSPKSASNVKFFFFITGQ